MLENDIPHIHLIYAFHTSVIGAGDVSGVKDQIIS
jgi:hypothetical protein